MFGLSWAQLAIIALVGAFVLGPERIPTATAWVLTTLGKARTMAAGAQAGLRRDIGPEIEELRRQVAELQSLKQLADLRELQNHFDPRQWIAATPAPTASTVAQRATNTPVTSSPPAPGPVPTGPDRDDLPPLDPATHARQSPDRSPPS